jgi:hypothetical protein
MAISTERSEIRPCGAPVVEFLFGAVIGAVVGAVGVCMFLAHWTLKNFPRS